MMTDPTMKPLKRYVTVLSQRVEGVGAGVEWLGNPSRLSFPSIQVGLGPVYGPFSQSISMGDNEAYDFDLEEADLLAGGGGGYEEDVDDVDDAGGGGVDEGGGQEVEQELEDKQGEEKTEDQRKSLKKRGQIVQLKERKRQRVAEGEVEKAEALTTGTLVSRSQSSPEDQFRLFMQHQPKTAAGSILASFLPGDFFHPGHSGPNEGGKKKKSPGKSILPPLVCAMEAGMGADFRKKLAHSSEEMGCPVVLILCSSARRAADVIKQISPKLQCFIAKLFAKHFKVTEQVQVLAKQHFPVAVGTPNRIHKLLELGALCLKSTTVILVDTAVDTKNFSILDLPSVCEDFYTLLGGYVQKEKAHIKIALVR